MYAGAITKHSPVIQIYSTLQPSNNLNSTVKVLRKIKGPGNQPSTQLVSDTAGSGHEAAGPGVAAVESHFHANTEPRIMRGHSHIITSRTAFTIERTFAFIPFGSPAMSNSEVLHPSARNNQQSAYVPDWLSPGPTTLGISHGQECDPVHYSSLPAHINVLTNEQAD
jgi:hypothetical protein